MRYLLLLLFALNITFAFSQSISGCQPSSAHSIFLVSTAGHQGESHWEMRRATEVKAKGAQLSKASFISSHWLRAIVPGTVLTSLVARGIYPDPYYGDNNRKSRKLIPDIADTGRDCYHYWYRTSFKVPPSFNDKRVWLKFHGTNYRSQIWVNGKNIGTVEGMFNTASYDITNILDRKGVNILAVDVQPIDFPGSYYKPGITQTGAVGENHNGGDGDIGKNVTMLMSVGWDFTAPDGIRDRNTGIWRDVELYATGDVVLENPFIQTKLPLPDTLSARETVSVEVKNATNTIQRGLLSGRISENNSRFSQLVTLKPHETKMIVFDPAQYPSLIMRHPKLWWPVNKGAQHLYQLSLKFTSRTGSTTALTGIKFGVREITTDQNSPDHSRRFYVNGQPIFIRGTNWVPEAMLKNTTARTYAELYYTRQAGVNLLRLWGGGIAESDYFYQRCDELGLLVWNEFWLTADTHFPADTGLYFRNLKSTIKRIRNHPALAYYVAANEGGEVPGTGVLIHKLDSTRDYQEQSECCGVHDGSPYKYENPMQYFENTASKRGSRIDGFNPEYGTPCLPIAESLKKMMPLKDQWPINDSVWNYLDGNGFHQMTTKYRDAVDAFGKSASLEEFARKAQFVGALNYRAIWEVWNYNKFNYGDRFASGFLFWYHNSPLPQTASRMYDWYLEPTAALYYSQNGLAPLHPQYDYLKNTVSVYNDYRRAFPDYQVEATVYNLDATPVWHQQKAVNIPADGVVNDAMKIAFPAGLSDVHFIKLILQDEWGGQVADAFYWRSKDTYKGAWTMTGPAVAGFQDINKLAKIHLSVNATIKGSQLIADVSNPSKSLSFFTQLKLENKNGETIRPAFYSDNFFNLLPGESKRVIIDFSRTGAERGQLYLVTDGFNAVKQVRFFRTE